MSATDFNDLIRHEEHEITIATYYDINLNTINVAIECMDCHEVLLDFDKEPEPNAEYEKTINDVLDTIGEMRSTGDYDENTLETLEWKLSPPKPE
jgi:hypothetical protein